MTEPKHDDFVLTPEEIGETKNHATQPDWDKHPGALEAPQIDEEAVRALADRQLRFVDGED